MAKRLLRAAICLALVSTIPAIVYADEASDLAQRNYQHNRVLDSVSGITMTLTNASGQKRVRKLGSKTKLKPGDGNNMRLLSFTYPADVKGTVTLLIENTASQDGMWIYLPALKKVRRLVSENKRDSFVGSDLSFGDVLGHKPEDWAFTFAGQEKIGGINATVLDATPRTPQIARDTGYSRRKLCIDPDTAAALRTDYWDEASQPLKIVSVSDIRVVDAQHGKTQFMRIEATNQQSGQSTLMVFDQFKANSGVNAAMFSPNSIGDEP